LAGVLAGLDYAEEKGFHTLVSCLRLPLPSRRSCRAPLRGGAKIRFRLACAASGGRTHHIVALWPTRLREKLRRALEEGLRKVGQFQQETGCAQVEWFFRERDPFFNVNTPEDLLLAREWLTTRPEP